MERVMYKTHISEYGFGRKIVGSLGNSDSTAFQNM